MRKICFLPVLLFFALFVYAADVPSPVGWVNDFAGVISPEYKEKLTSLIGELEQKTTAEITVVIIDSISPYGEIEYARLLFDNWKPGKKGKDNGVLVLLAIKERRWRIETGYGVEGILPDGLCGEIGRNYMVPYFKEGKYSEGLYYGVTAIANIIAKDAKVQIEALPIAAMPEVKESEDYSVFSLGFIPFGLLLIFFGNFLLFIIGLGFVWTVLSTFFGNKISLPLYLGAAVFLIFMRFIIRTLIRDETGNRGSWGSYYGGYGGGFGGGGGGFGGGGGGGGGAGGGF
jgi:uncharacterized protein